jgi:hypothetical protein
MNIPRYHLGQQFYLAGSDMGIVMRESVLVAELKLIKRELIPMPESGGVRQPGRWPGGTIARMQQERPLRRAKRLRMSMRIVMDTPDGIGITGAMGFQWDHG